MKTITDIERDKYSDIWSLAEYSICSPGKLYVDMFWDIAKPKLGTSLLDVGAGAGAASRVLKDKGLVVRGFDITNEAWRHTDIPLLTGCIWRDLPRGNAYDYVYCCDVMEHLPTEFTALAINEMLNVGTKAFYSISFQEDHYGDYVGSALHLTVKPFLWWRDMLRELGTVYEARDLLGDGVFYVGR